MKWTKWSEQEPSRDVVPKLAIWYCRGLQTWILYDCRWSSELEEWELDHSTDLMAKIGINNLLWAEVEFPEIQ